jgi:hypothetical protein
VFSEEQIQSIAMALFNLYFIGVHMRSYAGATGNEVLAQKTQFSRSLLDMLRTNDLSIVSNMLADACEEYSNDLVEYQVDRSTVNRLRELAGYFDVQENKRLFFYASDYLNHKK